MRSKQSCFLIIVGVAWFLAVDAGCVVDHNDSFGVEPTASQAYVVGTALRHDTLSVMTWNLACRDTEWFGGCDNWVERFAKIAEAINGAADVVDFPDLRDVDVLLTQEVNTTSATFRPIADAMAARGFFEVFGPYPDASSARCRAPFYWGAPHDEPANIRDGARHLAGDNGGLVMWSKHPVLAFSSFGWCVNGWPTYHGYSAALVNMNGRFVVIFNLHTQAEFDFVAYQGLLPTLPDISAEHVRMYQFSEIANLARSLRAQFSRVGAEVTIVVAGDLNEDAYGGSSRDAAVDCHRIDNRLTAAKFQVLGCDLQAECVAGKIGEPTWNTDRNTLAAQFGSPRSFELLDYVLRVDPDSIVEQPVNQVFHPRSTDGWPGTFCSDPTLGKLSPRTNGVAKALSDHEPVLATLRLTNAASAKPSNVIAAAFRAGLDGFDARAGACGQADTQCGDNTNCCASEDVSHDGFSYQCATVFDQSDIQRPGYNTCQPCVKRGEPCRWTAGECCGSDTFPQGNYCKQISFDSAFACSPKESEGASCRLNEECQSDSCRKTGWFEFGEHCAPVVK